MIYHSNQIAMTPDQLREKAEKVIALSKRMEEAFPYGYADEHLLMCIMAGLHDSYISGVVSGETKTKP